jgi:hypothetical protein
LAIRSGELRETRGIAKAIEVVSEQKLRCPREPRRRE